jgi:hypothetical protein
MFFSSRQQRHRHLWQKAILPCLCAVIAILYLEPAKAIDCEVTVDTSPTAIATAAQTTATTVAVQASHLEQIAEWIETKLQWINDQIDKAKDKIEDRLEAQEQKALQLGAAQAQMDQNKNGHDAHHAAEFQANATQSDTSMGCATIQTHQYKNTMKDMAEAMAISDIKQSYYQGSFQTGVNGAQRIPTPPAVFRVCSRIGNGWTFFPSYQQVQTVFNGSTGCKGVTSSQ